MIAVIADDFTGAAEIGGIGLRHHLNVILETEAIKHKDVDLLIVATDTRSMKSTDAEAVVAKITKELVALKPRFIFKKVDSALRGNIYGELKAQMDASGVKRTLLVAGNPIFGRTIRNGCYYINDVPLHKTGFATDPDFPIKSSMVNEIIGTGTYPLTVGLTSKDALSKDGICVGDVVDLVDLDRWAACVGNDTIPAGASGFFDAMCRCQTSLNRRDVPVDIPFGETVLYILGSSYPKDEQYLEQLAGNKLYVSNMPSELYYGKTIDNRLVVQWADDIVKGLVSNKRVVTVVTHMPESQVGMANRVKQVLGQVTRLVLEKTTVEELLVEGGSTVSAVLSSLGTQKLFPLHEYATGIIRMKVDGFPRLCLTTKPGSYMWPSEIWGAKDGLEKG